MRLSDLQSKDVINITDGKKIGNIIDVKLENNGIMQSIIIEKSKFFVSMFTNKDEIEITWEQIQKIGEDVILVKLNLWRYFKYLFFIWCLIRLIKSFLL